jgi:hypothetical protein
MFSRSNPYRSRIIRGAFIVGSAAVGISLASDFWKKKDKRLHKRVVIVGGGTAGVGDSDEYIQHILFCRTSYKYASTCNMFCSVHMNIFIYIFSSFAYIFRRTNVYTV